MRRIQGVGVYKECRTPPPPMFLEGSTKRIAVISHLRTSITAVQTVLNRLNTEEVKLSKHFVFKHRFV